MIGDLKDGELSAPGKMFATTHWSVIMAAGGEDGPLQRAALERLCRAYWYPLYAYVRRKGHSPHDSQDLIQAFFLHLLEHARLGDLEPAGGRFRSFLLTALNRFLANEWHRLRTQKRGGGQEVLSLDVSDPELRYQLEPRDGLTPEALLERRWALTLLDRAHARLKAQYDAEGKSNLFEHLQNQLTGANAAPDYAQLATVLQCTEGALRVAVHRLRKRYGHVLREEVALIHC